jgi:hypothetical protein
MKTISLKFISVLIGTIILTGCATGIIPTDKGAFMSQKNSAGGAFGDPQSVLADLYREANDFCAKNNQVVETISSIPEKGIPFVRPARATLNFRCVAK